MLPKYQPPCVCTPFAPQRLLRQGICNVPCEILISGHLPAGHQWCDSVTGTACWEVGESRLPRTSGDISGGQEKNNNSSVATGGEGFSSP